jgi:hypothetical protein
VTITSLVTNKHFCLQRTGQKARAHPWKKGLRQGISGKLERRERRS